MTFSSAANPLKGDEVFLFFANLRRIFCLGKMTIVNFWLNCRVVIQDQFTQILNSLQTALCGFFKSPYTFS